MLNTCKERKDMEKQEENEKYCSYGKTASEKGSLN